jgi:serine protease AprX
MSQTSITWEETSVPEQAVEQARQARPAAPDHAPLRFPFPDPSADAARIVPTPLRVNANPQFTGRGVTMAFLDSGFYPHPDLTRPVNRILAYADALGPDVVEKSNFKRPHLTSWHGLMTASIATGNGFMSEGLYRGPASRAALVLVKTGNRRGRGIRERDIHRALAWVIANRERFNVRVVNISLGGDHPSPGRLTELDALVEEAVAQGMVVVAAVGNSGARRVVPPASAPSALTVGGVDDQNSLDLRRRRMWRSSYGLGARRAPKPEVVAPAVWLAAPMLPRTWVHNEALFLWQLERSSDRELRRFLETDYAQTRFKKETLRLPLSEIRRAIRERMNEQKLIHPHYQHVDGTSMAAPIVSAVAAQMLEANPLLTPAQVKELIVATAEPLDDAPEEQQGAGAVNAGAAVAAALRAPGGLLEGLPCSPRATRRTVTFYYFHREARSVALVGTFNDWQPRGHTLHGPALGVWQITLPRLPRGVHRYKFLVDDGRLVHDPENPARVEDGCGGFHSVLAL